MEKQNIQNSSYLQREKNFFRTITSEDTFQVIVGRYDNILLLWQDEFYMKEYLTACRKRIILSKIDTISFLKWIKENKQEFHFFLHPVFEQNIPEISKKELIEKTISRIESDGDFYSTLKENNLL
mgnify:CR=1 FL=1